MVLLLALLFAIAERFFGGKSNGLFGKRNDNRFFLIHFTCVVVVPGTFATAVVAVATSSNKFIIIIDIVAIIYTTNNII